MVNVQTGVCSFYLCHVHCTRVNSSCHHPDHLQVVLPKNLERTWAQPCIPHLLVLERISFSAVCDRIGLVKTFHLPQVPSGLHSSSDGKRCMFYFMGEETEARVIWVTGRTVARWCKKEGCAQTYLTPWSELLTIFPLGTFQAYSFLIGIVVQYLAMGEDEMKQLGRIFYVLKTTRVPSAASEVTSLLKESFTFGPRLTGRS